jgi:hypothetical protein
VVGHVQHEIAPYDAQADHDDCMLLVWLLIRHVLSPERFTETGGIDFHLQFFGNARREVRIGLFGDLQCHIDWFLVQ